MKVDAADSSKKLMSICQTVQCFILKDNKLSINKDIKKSIYHNSGLLLLMYCGILQYVWFQRYSLQVIDISKIPKKRPGYG